VRGTVIHTYVHADRRVQRWHSKPHFFISRGCKHVIVQNHETNYFSMTMSSYTALCFHIQAWWKCTNPSKCWDRLFRLHNTFSNILRIWESKKVNFTLWVHHGIKIRGGVKLQLHVFITSWRLFQLHVPVNSSRGKWPGTHHTGNWVAPSASMDTVANRESLFQLGIGRRSSRTFQYTDWATWLPYARSTGVLWSEEECAQAPSPVSKVEKA
jgi:hypothetical protein